MCVDVIVMSSAECDCSLYIDLSMVLFVLYVCKLVVE